MGTRGLFLSHLDPELNRQRPYVSAEHFLFELVALILSHYPHPVVVSDVELGLNLLLAETLTRNDLVCETLRQLLKLGLFKIYVLKPERYGEFAAQFPRQPLLSATRYRETESTLGDAPFRLSDTAANFLMKLDTAIVDCGRTCLIEQTQDLRSTFDAELQRTLVEERLLESHFLYSPLAGRFADRAHALLYEARGTTLAEVRELTHDTPKIPEDLPYLNRSLVYRVARHVLLPEFGEELVALFKKLTQSVFFDTFSDAYGVRVSYTEYCPERIVSDTRQTPLHDDWTFVDCGSCELRLWPGLADAILEACRSGDSLVDQVEAFVSSDATGIREIVTERAERLTRYYDNQQRLVRGVVTVAMDKVGTLATVSSGLAAIGQALTVIGVVPFGTLPLSAIGTGASLVGLGALMTRPRSGRRISSRSAIDEGVRLATELRSCEGTLLSRTAGSPVHPKNIIRTDLTLPAVRSDGGGLRPQGTPPLLQPAAKMPNGLSLASDKCIRVAL